MRLKKGLRVRIIAGLPTKMQDTFDLGTYIGKEYDIVDHYQNYHSGLDKGKICVIIPEEGGTCILNSGEWELV